MSAITAAAAGGEPAVERHQIAQAERRPAIFAARSPPGDRPPFGQASNDDAEKAADKRCGDQHAPSCWTGVRHAVEQRRSDHVVLLPSRNVLVSVARSPAYRVVTIFELMSRRSRRTLPTCRQASLILLAPY